MSRLVEAARALSRGDGIGALALVGRAEDALGIALRGIAYAQLGDLEEARNTLRRADRAATDELLRARIRAALVEVALAEGDAGRVAKDAAANAQRLALLGDGRNAAMQRLVQARAEVLLGRADDARRTIDAVLAGSLALDLRPVTWLARAEIALRASAATTAKRALDEARRALEGSPNALLARTLDAMEEALAQPIARLRDRGEVRAVDLFAIEEAQNGKAFLVDACRRVVRAGRATIPLARRPVLFQLLFALANAWPNDVARDELARQAFAVRVVNASHRARMRVEIGRLRKVLHGIAEPIATRNGYALKSPRPVRILLPIADDEVARVAIFLGDGASWTAQAIAEQAGMSKRTAQRALAALVESGRVVRLSRGKDVRYASSSPNGRIASRLLLLGLASAT